MGVKQKREKPKDPVVTKAEVLRARRAYDVANIDPATLEPYAVLAHGADRAYAPTTAAAPAAKIAKIWDKMNAGERDWFTSFLTGQVRENPDTLAIDVGAAALAVVEAARGDAGAPREIPGLREAVQSLALSLKARGYEVEPGRLRAAPGRKHQRLDRPPLRPNLTLRFVAAGVRWAFPMMYRKLDHGGRRDLLLKECHWQLRTLRESGLI